MKITKAEHKMVLRSFFYTQRGEKIEERHIPREEQSAAASIYEKFAASIEEVKDQKGVSTGVSRFVDGEIEFTPSEIKVLVRLFQECRDLATISTAKIFNELAEIIETKVEEKAKDA